MQQLELFATPTPTQYRVDLVDAYGQLVLGDLDIESAKSFRTLWMHYGVELKVQITEVPA